MIMADHLPQHGNPNMSTTPPKCTSEAERWLDLVLMEVRYLNDQKFDAMMAAWLLMMGIGETHDQQQ